MAPIREVCSPVNSLKPGKPGIEAASKADRKIKHAPVYGPSTRGDAERSASRQAPGVVVDGTLTIKHLDRQK
jgi:hypothetical protein